MWVAYTNIYLHTLNLIVHNNTSYEIYKSNSANKGPMIYTYIYGMVIKIVILDV